MKNELKSIFKYLLDFTIHPEQYNNDMVALLKVEQVIELLNYIGILNKQLQQKENIIKEVREYIDEHAKWDYSGGTWEEHSVEWYDLDVTVSMFIKELLEILDKENKE